MNTTPNMLIEALIKNSSQVSDCVVLVLSGPRWGGALLEITRTSVLTVFSCRKWEAIESLMAVMQRIQIVRIFRYK